jgi:hypothetical protein
MNLAPNHDNAEDKFTIKLVYRWEEHLGYDRPGSVDGLKTLALQTERSECLKLLKAFKDKSEPLATECKYDEHTSSRDRSHHFDGGVTFQHAAHVLAICAGAVPLSVVIKATRDVLVKLIDKRSSHIRVTLGGGRTIQVGNVTELDEVLTRLEKSEFVKNSPMLKAKTARPPTSKTRVSKPKPKATAAAKPRQKS